MNQEDSIKVTFGSVDSLLDQCVQSWSESRKLTFPSNYKDIRNIVVCGMGGSSMPAFVINSAFKLAVPLQISQGYTLPSWADKNTLVVLSSYSGNTEETLSCGEEAIERGCLLTGITGGGSLKALLEEQQAPYYTFDPIHNPSKMPRFGVGYGIFGILGLLSNLKLVQEPDIDTQLSSAVTYVRENSARLMELARDFVNSTEADAYVVFSSGHLKGNGLVFANQINETSKRLGLSVELPEANHNLVEGFRKLQGSVAQIFISSENYHPRVQARFEITKEILSDAGYVNYVYEVGKGELLQEVLETLVFSSYCSVELARVLGSDPLTIPLIESTKSRLLTKSK